MEQLVILFILAIIIEAIWETIKLAVPTSFKIPSWMDRLGAMIIAIIIVICAHLDLLAMLGIPLGVPLIGMILTGLLISRGSNFMHDLLNRVQGVKISGGLISPDTPTNTGSDTKGGVQDAKLQE